MKFDIQACFEKAENCRIVLPTSIEYESKTISETSLFQFSIDYKWSFIVDQQQIWKTFNSWTQEKFSADSER